MESLREAAYALRHEAEAVPADARKGLIVAAELLERWDEEGVPVVCSCAVVKADPTLAKDGWPRRWSDPTYLGDGPWGA